MWTAVILALLTAAAAHTQEYTGTDTVYITRSGRAYHRDTCKALSRSKQAIALAEAVGMGYTACALCTPSHTSGASPAAVQKPADTLYRLNKENLGSYTQADKQKMLRAVVIRHIDGDTVELRFDNPPPGIGKTEKIRMIGADTPETVHPRKEVEYFGKEASEYTRRALLDKPVYIAFDWDTRDKYGRLLTYIYTENGRCHNAELIKQGYAHAYTRFPFQFLEEFKTLEKNARTAKRGLWSRTP
jgi:micrococcal nuclease